MIIKNITNQTYLAKDAKFCLALKDKLLGLLDKNHPPTLIFKTRFGIHTFMLKATIDVLILNNNKQIVKIKENLPPNSLFFWNPKYNLVIELPPNTIKKSQTKLGDKIHFS